MSNNTPAVFQFNNHPIRTIEKDGEAWFIAKDVAETLGYSNARDAISRHCKGAADVVIHDGSQNRSMTIIPERDMYRLVMKSTLPGAEQFEEWVVAEVLPTIRKTGSYNAPTLPTDTRSLLFTTIDVVREINTEVKQLERRTDKLESHMTTLTDTFRLHDWQKFELKAAANKKVKELIWDCTRPTGALYGKLWGYVKNHFQVVTYHNIPAVRFEEAKLIVQNVTVRQLGGAA